MKTVWRAVVLVFASVSLARAQAPASPSATDPYGRDTPRRTVAGFTFAAHSGDYESATHYLQLTDAQRAAGESLARELDALIDRYYSLRLISISDAREGSLRDGLSPYRERMSLAIGARGFDVLLVRVNDPDSGPIWLFSSESLARMASVPEIAGDTWVERVMPATFVRHSIFGLSLAQWSLWLLSFVAPFLVLSAAGTIGVRIAQRRNTRHASVPPWYRELRWPAVLTIAIVIHWLTVPWLGITFTVRVTYARWLFGGLLLISAWFVWRLVGLSFERARHVAVRRHQSSVASLMLLVERVAKAALVLAVVLGILTAAGLDTTTALAGLGLGGIAVALGAQKSVENLLGGVFLLADGALAVGDFCNISTRSGWVEDITLRSVRLRTVEQTLVSIPAGVLAQTTVENFATRRKMLIQSTLPLQYGTSGAQVEAIIEGIGRRLATDGDLERGTSRVQLVNLGPAAIELEVYAYARTADVATYMRVRERLLLEVFSIVENTGARFARPTEIVVAASRA
jgi:MscS family membrane protein